MDRMFCYLGESNREYPMRLLLARSGVAFLTLSLVNCTAWRATQAPLSELKGKTVRITTSGGERKDGELVNADSLGLVVLHNGPPHPRDFTLDTTTIAIVEKRVSNPGGSVALVISAVLVIGLLVLATSQFYGDSFYDH